MNTCGVVALGIAATCQLAFSVKVLAELYLTDLLLHGRTLRQLGAELRQVHRTQRCLQSFQCLKLVILIHWLELFNTRPSHFL